MRSEKEMYQLIETLAQQDSRIRAVLLQGSRANDKVEKDRYQDYDLVFLVDDVPSFLAAPDWIDVFGERLIMQTPTGMDMGDGPDPNPDDRMTYLMQLKDGNRIDLHLIPASGRAHIKDSLTKVLLDKDQLYPNPDPPSDQDYWIQRPTQKQFADCCNEFWWVSTYVIKGLLRQEIIYAQDMLAGPVRKMFMRLLAWEVGSRHDFSINLGSSYRFLQKYVSQDLWDKILLTYPDAQEENMWQSLQLMMAIFAEREVAFAKKMGYFYDREEMEHVQAYLRKMIRETP